MIELLKYMLFGAAFWVTPEPIDIYAKTPYYINTELSAVNGGASFSIDITHLISVEGEIWKYMLSEKADLDVFRNFGIFIDAYFDGGVVRFYYNGEFSYGNDYLRMFLSADTAGRIRMVGKKINKIKIISNKDLLGVKLMWSNGHL